MSADSSPSPPQVPTEIDESRMPQGQCRYILLLPEIKGHRCGCVGFSLNRAMPSATCDCGHLACFHLPKAKPETDKHELDQLRERIKLLEEQLDLKSVVQRVSDLEEQVDRRRDDAQQETKKVFGHVAQVWQSVKELQEHTQAMNTRIAGADAEIQWLKNRSAELVDADMSLEERMDRFENAEERSASRGRRPRRKSASDTSPLRDVAILSPHRRRSSASRPSAADSAASRDSDVFPAASTFMAFRGPPVNPNPPCSWTVHISLLPSASLPFPFERDTNAYKRCLSRGLHQVVVIGGLDSRSFISAVSRAFGSLLRGRSWMPLQAKLCNAEPLQGLPMLRQLDADLVDNSYDTDFLKQHCGVCDPSGKIESLYICMRFETLSWHALRHSPVYIDGLEASWAYDHLLDGTATFDDDAMDDDERPSAGAIVANLSTLKRGAAEISRTNSFGSSAAGPDGEASRAKIQRTRMAGLVEAPRRVETV
jgi:hypothetical protein